jgi:hypothetical protein
LKDGKALTVEEYAEIYRKMSDDDLITEFGCESWAAERTIGSEESEDSSNSLKAARAELLSRMSLKKEKA